jgi:LysR family transcriptional regulator (chromosome initiation inhibitor)
LRHAEEVGVLEHALSRDLGTLLPRRDAPLIAVTADSLATFVLPALAEAEGFLFDLVIDDQDFSADLLRRGEVAAAVTTADAPVPGCDAIALLGLCGLRSPRLRTPLVCRWCDSIGPRARARDHLQPQDRLQRRMAERMLALPTHFIGSTQDITAAAVAGLGWAVNPVSITRPHLIAGDLVDLCPGSILQTPLVWQVLRRNAPALRPLTRSLKRAARNLSEKDSALVFPDPFSGQQALHLHDQPPDTPGANRVCAACAHPQARSPGAPFLWSKNIPAGGTAPGRGSKPRSGAQPPAPDLRPKAAPSPRRRSRNST